MAIFTQNTKLAKSSDACVLLMGFALEPGFTCPFAGACREFCYAKHGLYKAFPAACKKRWDSNFALTQSDEGFAVIQKDITRLQKNADRAFKLLGLRLHTEGDFYSLEYAKRWLETACQFPGVRFYAYTKSHIFFERMEIPDNFHIIASEGGKHDDHLKDFNGPIARVVDTHSGLHLIGSYDDKVALFSRGKAVIELIKH